MSYEIDRNEANPIAEYKQMLQRLIELGMENSDKVDRLDGRIDKIEKEVDTMKFDEEVTYEQQQGIDNAISKTIYSILGIGSNPSKWTMHERTENQKYGKLFRRRLRHEVANKGHLAYPYRTTKKGNYTSAIKDIEAWVPRYGIDALKKEADDNARARRIARGQGYDV